MSHNFLSVITNVPRKYYINIRLITSVSKLTFLCCTLLVMYMDQWMSLYFEKYIYCIRALALVG